MSRNFTRRSGVPQRIKNMMFLINNESLDQHSNKRNTSTLETNPTVIVNNTHPEQNLSSSGTNMISTQCNMNDSDLVDSLYAREYSMTSEVFQNFCETQTTATSNHFDKINNIIISLKGSDNVLNTTQPETTSQEDAGLLLCSETMPIHSPAQNPQHATRDIPRDTEILFCGETMQTDSPGHDPRPAMRDILQEGGILTCRVPMPISSPAQDPQQTTRDIPRETGILFCSESMQINSPTCDPQPITPQETETLSCKETMPSSSSSVQGFTLSPTKFNNGDYDSDDSVKDKDYEPSDDGGGSIDTSDDEIIPEPKNLLPETIIKHSKKKRTTVKIAQGETKSVRRHSMETMTSNRPVNSLSLNKRRMTIDSTVCVATPTLNGSEETIQELNNPPAKRRKYNTSLKQRMLEKQSKKMDRYKVKNGCDNKCMKKCSSVFTTDEREEINRKYWNMTRAEMRVFIRSNYTVAVPKRKYTNEPKRNPRRCFTLQKNNGTLVSVCKIFFLTTLGFGKCNDKILSSSLDANKDSDKRGKHIKIPKFDRDIITKHIESFNPSAPHYRREHAPNRRYLPSEININFMYKDFCTKHSDVKIRYEMYRTHLKTMNISFARLGNEECELCESYTLHTRDTNHDVRKEIIADCQNCEDWAAHHEKYKKARQLYDSHKSIEQNEEQIYYSSDLEKVIMLPRIETFKAVIFCPRLTAFNQTFAPVGKISKNSKPLAAIWHDGIAGRKQEDIMSAYYNFFLRFRDVKIINIWMDNCTAQNKNWLFFSMLADLVNSDVIATDRIILYYFEPGHTFMSCDQFHHQVELSMKKKGKIYDFDDFEDAVASANNGKVILKSMQPQDFINYTNNVSERRIQNANPRAYLKNISQVCFIRSSFDLHYKNNFEQEDYMTLKFLNDRFLKNPQLSITLRLLPKGVEKDRKENIINKLSPIIPKHKMMFWKNLPILSKEIHPNNCNKRATK